jgi:hypothetical protein
MNYSRGAIFSAAGRPMVYCPKCGAEYREGFSECSDCRVPLVWEKPTKSEQPEGLGDSDLQLAAKREELQAKPFDPRTEVSADAYIAGRIVTHLWLLFVLLPFIIGVLLVLIGVIK